MTSSVFARSLHRALIIAALFPLGRVVAQQPPAKSANQRAAESQPVTYVRVSGVDYSFVAPEFVKPGIVTFNLVNDGADLHALAVFELPSNHTVRDFLDQYHRHGMIPVWMTALGSTPTIASDAETFLTVRLKPGRYVLACVIPARDGRMHSEKGMVTLITAR